MTQKKASSAAADDLRRRTKAVDRLHGTWIPDNLDALSPEAVRRVLQELRVHQVELEMQNEELRQAQENLEVLRAKYFGLYELAPVGYVTLSERGLILEANLTVAKLLGQARSRLIKQPGIDPGQQRSGTGDDL